MYVGASAPPAPGLSSTTIFLPSVFVAASPIARKVTLLLLPGEYACSSVMFLSGKFCAHAGAAASSSAQSRQPASLCACNIDTPPCDGMQPSHFVLAAIVLSRCRRVVFHSASLSNSTVKPVLARRATRASICDKILTPGGIARCPNQPGCSSRAPLRQ